MINTTWKRFLLHILLCKLVGVFWLYGAVASAATIFVESGGQVVMEAEHFSENVPHATHTWDEIVAGTAPFSNSRGNFMQSLPNIENNNNNNDPFGALLANSPVLSYTARISTPGDYRLFLRWAGPTGADDSMYASIAELRNGQGGAADWYRYEDDPDDADFATSPWDGMGEFEGVSGSGNDVNAVWSITNPGDYTVQVLRREDGSAIDALVLQRTSLAAPTGMGPAESAIIPEPSAIWLAAMGLLAVFGISYSVRNRA